MNKKIEAIIFDCDGVIVDSEILSHHAIADLICQYADIEDAEAYSRSFFGLTEERIIENARRDFGAEFPDDIVERVKQVIDEVLQKDLEAVPGMPDVVREVAEKLPLAMASNSGHQRLRQSLTKVGLYACFAGRIASNDDVPVGKPNPDIYRLALRLLGRDTPDNVIAIEDSLPGIRAAKAAGIEVIGFTGAGHIQPGHDEAMRKEGVFAVAKNAKSLALILRELF